MKQLAHQTNHAGGGGGHFSADPLGCSRDENVTQITKKKSIPPQCDSTDSNRGDDAV